MKKLKKITRKLHLWLGLASGLVVFIVAFTGSILVFEKELDRFFDPDLHVVPEVSPERLPVDVLIKKAQEKHPGTSLHDLFVFDDPERSVFMRLADEKGEWTVVSADQYSGAILKDALYKKRFFTVVNELHRFLLMGETGKTITGISCILFVVLLTSGLILWWPLKRKHFKQRLKVKWGASFKRVNWDFHSVFGFYSSLFLLLTALTGLVWSFDWYENLMYFLADGKPKPVHLVKNVSTDRTDGQNYFYEPMLRETDSLFRYHGDIRLIVSPQEDRSILVLKENLEASIPNVRDMAYFDKYSGKRLKTTLYKDLSTGDKVRRLVYPIHIGSIYGYPTKILAFVICLFAASSPITGFLIWWGRKKKKNKERAEKQKKRKINPRESKVLLNEETW